jgi:hypothetical protein
VIRLLLDPPHFECDEPGEAAVLAELLGIKAVPVPPVIVREPIATPTLTSAAVVGKKHGWNAPGHTSPEEFEAAKKTFAKTGVLVARAKGQMAPTGHSKTCKKCGASFPILDRTDCPSVYCRACRPAPNKPRKPRLPVPAAMKAARPTAQAQVRKHADPVSCSRCGASVPEFESINGECLECAPMGARKTA